MTDLPYSKREIDVRLDGLERRLFHEEEGFLPRIERQVMLTNGKVRRIIMALVLIFGILIGAGSKYAPLILSLIV
jgi:hypothetical protein